MCFAWQFAIVVNPIRSMEFPFFFGICLLQLLAFCAFIAVARAGLVSHGHAFAAPAHYAAAPVAGAYGSRIY